MRHHPAGDRCGLALKAGAQRDGPGADILYELPEIHCLTLRPRAEEFPDKTSMRHSRKGESSKSVVIPAEAGISGVARELHSVPAVRDPGLRQDDAVGVSP